MTRYEVGPSGLDRVLVQLKYIYPAAWLDFCFLSFPQKYGNQFYLRYSIAYSLIA